MPASMSSAAPTPVAEREARLVDELADDPAEHEAGRVADPLDVAAERARRTPRRRGRRRPRCVALRVSSTSPPSGDGGEEAGRGALRVELGQRRLVAQQHRRGRPAAARRPRRARRSRRSAPGPRRRRRPRDRRRASRASRRRVAQLLGQRGGAGDHDEPPVAAARLGRRRVLGPVRARPRRTRTSRGRSCGRGCPTPTLRAASIDGRQRGSPNDCA